MILAHHFCKSNWLRHSKIRHHHDLFLAVLYSSKERDSLTLKVLLPRVFQPQVFNIAKRESKTKADLLPFLFFPTARPGSLSDFQHNFIQKHTPNPTGDRSLGCNVFSYPDFLGWYYASKWRENQTSLGDLYRQWEILLDYKPCFLSWFAKS